jgi:organic hydroperoxide reductase OsmC/OhrA
VSEVVHRYSANLTWRGSTGQGYEAYDRTHRGQCPPAGAVLELSADPGFRGRAELLDPEQLVVLAASSCQLLSFLAVAARSRIDVVSYEDDAEGEMPSAEGRITAIRLNPRITVQGRASEARVLRAVEVAHSECYVARTLSCPVSVAARVTLSG